MKILIAYDGSNCADAAIEDLARAGLPRRAEARVVSVAEAETKSDAESMADNACRLIRRGFPEWALSIETMWGSPAKAILDATSRWHPDLLIAGSHGRSRVARLFLGSVSLELMHKAPCSIRVVRSHRPVAAGPIKMVIGADGSISSQAMIRSIAQRSWPDNTEAEIISAVQTLEPLMAGRSLEASTYAQEPAYSVIREADEHERERLNIVADNSVQLLRQAGLIASSIVTYADPRELILATAETINADTIFVGARGLGRMERLLLGSVSTYVVGHAGCSVEVVRQRSSGTASGLDLESYGQHKQ